MTFRYKEAEFSDTWTLYVSFETYIQARKACRIRAKFLGNSVFKHMANEKVDLDYDRTYFFEAIPGKCCSNGKKSVQSGKRWENGVLFRI